MGGYNSYGYAGGGCNYVNNCCGSNFIIILILFILLIIIGAGITLV
ncbi:YjcZ family sporulation protein [Bacillus carboniphilus]|uniref:YjcZ family sporulation protein n=1 Tax=Bacillus carboniphilus TaxID=86663 RepID=A0ABY9JWK7_9BACI|nr:YjcZ family sporulation protein [Bacillus carboniphilus]WLR43184.1 YjcZ family sporulation protein [Bacillus carboniphilus]